MKRVFYQSRASICPVCHQVLQADLAQDEQGLYLEKFCPAHGHYSTRIAADYDWLSNLQHYAAHTVIPKTRQTEIQKGCPVDCGECPGHRQMAAFFLFEITNSCDLNCPICLGQPQDRGYFISPDEMTSMVDKVLEYAGPGQIVTLGGGEPTVHPEFFKLVDILKKSDMHDIWVYTNGCRIACDPNLARQLAEENLNVVLQWDGFNDDMYTTLRGRPLLEEKKRALEHLKASGARMGMCATIVKGINDRELGQIYKMFMDDPAMGILDIATMAYVGKGEQFDFGREQRITAQDVLFALEEQTDGEIQVADFSPVSFSHPQCLQIAYHFPLPDGDYGAVGRHSLSETQLYVPLKRFLDPEDYRSLVLNKPLVVLNAEIIEKFRNVVNKLWASGKDDSETMKGLSALRYAIETLFPGQETSQEDLATRSRALVKVVLIHSYMDGLNFDVGRAKMCISRTMLPDGRLMPTCAYNVVHRSRLEAKI